jgi:hypothetical protein
VNLLARVVLEPLAQRLDVKALADVGEVLVGVAVVPLIAQDPLYLALESRGLGRDRVLEPLQRLRTVPPFPIPMGLGAIDRIAEQDDQLCLRNDSRGSRRSRRVE